MRHHRAMESSPLVARFAPSPTGYLHLGHAHSALFGWRIARAAGGRFLLRIEDIDPTRRKPDHVAAVTEDLAWLGLDWDGPVRRQSQHEADYAAALARLTARGALYPCFCTRADIQAEIDRAGAAPHGPEGPIYPGLCRGLDPADAARRQAAGDPFALRLNMAHVLATAPPLRFHDDGAWTTADPAPFGDVVVARKETPTSYHLAVTVDDALQGVTLVTRGEDLRPATHIHRLLQWLLDLPTPAYRHHPLLRGPDGKRLAKRDGATALRDLRAQGITPAQVRALAGFGEQEEPK